MTQPTDRPGIDQLTSDMLDQLYADLDWAREQTLAAQQEATAAATRAERAEATLTAVRALHAPVQYSKQTICGHCSGYGGGSCDNSPEPHPCPTVAVLDQRGQTPKETT